MNLIVDLHVHSHYSRATSKDCTLEGLYKWGKIKGINIIGTGDFTHPLWFKEIREKLEPAEPGLYRLREDIARNIDTALPESVRNNLIRFVLTVEISNIYSKYGRVHKVHNLIISPSFNTVQELNTQLSNIGNLHADGRPILGMDSKELLKLSLATNPDNLFIPAHIWTPWFGMFGSKSGFDSIEESFEELAPKITAIETGLSSDPYMNWSVKELQNRAITSHSDAHSPQKLGREATVMNCKLSYKDIIDGIKTNDSRLVGTIEFFPQEGKYHYDGHRACNFYCEPQKTKDIHGICPVCKKKLTIGVEYRVNELAEKNSVSTITKTNKTVEYIIPLVEVISGIKGVGTGTKTVNTEYEKLYGTFGDEFHILRNIPIETIYTQGFPEVAHTIALMRKGEITIEPGYDGVYGKIQITSHTDHIQINEQLDLI